MSDDAEMLWVPDQEQLWLPAQLVRRDADSFMVRYLDGREVHLLGDPDKFQRIAPGSLEVETEDLAQLELVNEGMVHYVLRRRFDRGDYYTLAGNILLSLCPHTPDVPSLPLLRDYIEGLQQQAALPPHLFTVAARAHSALSSSENAQAVLLMGVSGSGKTTAAMQLLQGFARSSESGNFASQLDAFVKITHAFGHARAGRNQLSSRYAMWTSIGFSSAGELQGFHHQMYNLEKSRITLQAGGDSNFFVFYMLLSGVDEDLRRSLHIRTSNPGAYAFLSHAPAPLHDAMDQGLAELSDALSIVGINEDQQRDLYSALVAILHLGNIVFEDDGDKGCKILDAQQMSAAAQALRVESVQLDSSLRFRETIMDRSDKYLVELDKRRTVEQRDAMAKELYTKLLDWLFTRINASAGQAVQPDSPNTIAILDLCGFQVADVNSLEHLCVNYWNEKLHQYFTDITVTSEVEMYKEEGLPWDSSNVGGANLCVDLFESRGGLLSMLEEEAALPRGSDSKLISRFHSAFAESGPNKCYGRNRRKNEIFVIRHFADEVNYTIDGFVDKAKDAVPPQIAPLLASSENQLIRTLFTSTDEAAAEPGRKPKRNALRVKAEVQQLMGSLSKMTPHFVQCVKTNPKLLPTALDGQLVMQQFTNAGLYDKILVKQRGWDVQFSHEQFVNQFILCLPRVQRPTTDGVASKAREILEYVAAQQDIPSDGFELGATKVFFRSAKYLAGLPAMVEAGRLRLLVKLQSRIRGLRGRRIAQEKHHERQMIAQAEQARLNRENTAMRAEDELMRAIIEAEQLAIRLKKEEEERLERERLERLAAERAFRQKSATKIQSVVRGNADRAKFVVYSAVMKLQQAMQSADEGQLSAAIHDAVDVKNQFPTVMILRMLQEANQILKRARQVRQTREQLTDAIVHQDMNQLRHVLVSCEESGCTELPEYSQALQHLQRLEAKQQLVHYLKFLGDNAPTPAALLAQSDEIDYVLGQVYSMGLSEHPVVVGMSNRLVRIERLRNLRDDLRDACETVSQRAIKLAMDRLKPSILLHGDTLCETEVTAAIQILKMLELENRVREDELRDDGGQSLMGNDVGEWNDDHPRLPVRIRRRLDMLQRAATDSERQYVMRVLEAECPSPSMLAKYKRAYKWVVAFCTWKYKTTPSSTTGTTVHPATDTKTVLSFPTVRTGQREDQPLLGSLRTLWTESSFIVQEMDFDTLVAEFTSPANFEQKRGVPVADQLIADALESNKIFESKRPYRPAFK